MKEYFVALFEFLILGILAIIMFKSMINNDKKLLFSVLFYIILYALIILIFPYIQKWFDVYNHLILDPYAIILAMLSWIIFFATIILAIFKRKKTFRK